jgi:outer membrane protein OmpA-like peptidoglycan-associated protein
MRSLCPSILSAFACVVAFWAAAPASAQIIIGGEARRPPVVVDLGAIDQMLGGGGADIVPRPAPRPGTVTRAPLQAPRSAPRPLVAAPTAPRPALAAPVAPVIAVPKIVSPAVASAAPALAPPPARVVTAPPAVAPPVANVAAPPVVRPQPQASPAPIAAAPLVAAAKPAVAATAARSDGTRLNFDPGQDQLTDAQRAELAPIVRSLQNNADSRLEIVAFASGNVDRPSDARRTSLTRAVRVRGFLVDQGVRSARIDVRALGADSQGGPPDRVELTIKG